MGVNQFRVQVYENAYVSSTAGINMDKSGLLAAPELGQTSGLRFRTKLPGGFDQCSFTFAGSLIEAVRWKGKFLAQHLEVLSAGQYAFYGIIEDILLDRIRAQVQVTADGYYFTLEDERYNTTSTTSETMKNAIWWALSQQGAAKDWRGYFLDGGVGDVTDTNTKVQRRIGSNGNETAREAVELWCQMGDSSNNRYWPAVWDSRKLRVDQESTTTKWYVRVQDMNLATFGASRKDVWNHIVVSYQDVADGTRKDSTAAQDTTSQQRYGLKQLLYPGGEMNTTAANQLAATLLARLKDPRDRPQIGVDRIHDTGLVERPLWLVRAGDIIEAIDLELPDRPAGEQVTGRNKWLIRETDYDADSNTLTLTPDQEERSVELTIQQSLDALRIEAAGVASEKAANAVLRHERFR